MISLKRASPVSCKVESCHWWIA